jgi:hypothetical protein
MASITICPKEMYSHTPITEASALDFEKNFIAPLLEIIEACEKNDTDIELSSDIFDLIIQRAPWSECDDPVVSAYLNSWHTGIAQSLYRFAKIKTENTPPREICNHIADANINNHFKNLLEKLSATTKPTITGVNHLGIHVKNSCAKNSECVCNILLKDQYDLKYIKTPWYLAYPPHLPDSGEYPFKPPKDWENSSGAKKGGEKGNGYIDEAGHSWEWDMLHKDHWDVQRGGTGNYTNVSPEGKILKKK